MTTPLSILEAARARLADPARWCQGRAALTTTGRPTSPIAKAASRWCILGAVERCAHEQGNDGHSVGRAVTLLYLQVRKKRGDGCATSVFNDTSTHKDVLGILDAAIEAARKE